MVDEDEAKKNLYQSEEDDFSASDDLPALNVSIL